MIRSRLARGILPLLAAPRSFLRAVLTVAGLTAIIVGILAMHVWMGGQGSASHHVATAVPAAVPAAAHASGMPTAIHAGMPAGCGGDCADEMLLGMCALAMIVVGVAGLLTPAGRALLSNVRRGPPARSRASRPAPAPSLTQLCISRT